MASGANMFKASLVLLLSFVLNANLGLCWPPAPWPIPAACKRFDFRCPKYEVIETTNKYEIRRFIDTGTWLSTSPIYHNTSIVTTTLIGLKRLYPYMNTNLASPVKTHVNSNGSHSYNVSVYVFNDTNLKNLPSNLHVESLRRTYIAAYRFDGYLRLRNDTYLQKVSDLKNSLLRTKWQIRLDLNNITFSAVQYNTPFEHTHRVNETWFEF